MTSKAFLRNLAADPRAVEQALDRDVRDLDAALAAQDAGGVLRLAGRCGEALRMVGRVEEAAPLLVEAVLLARTLGDARYEAVNSIRLATALQWLDRHDVAEEFFRRAIELNAEFEDFAQQHLGKCLAEMGRMDEARVCFERALALRRESGDPGLIASTEEALSRLESDRPKGPVG